LPRVTVGIPFYNEEETLAGAIRSVFAQTQSDWELILVDDGSTDGSLDIARSVDDPRVRVVGDGQHRGLSARLNQIVVLASARLVARMDADDLMHPERLRSQLSYLAKNPTVDVVGTGMFILDGDDLPVAKRLAPVHPMSALAALSRGCFIHASVMGRREWFARYPYDSGCDGAEDRELWTRAFGRSTFSNLQGCYYYYREYRSLGLRHCSRVCKLLAKVYRRNGPRLVGRGAVGYLSVRECAKPLVYTAAVGLGLQQQLIRRRSCPLTPAEQHEAICGLEHIKAARLPAAGEAAVGLLRGEASLGHVPVAADGRRAVDATGKTPAAVQSR